MTTQLTPEQMADAVARIFGSIYNDSTKGKMQSIIRQLWAEREQMREEIDRLRSIKVTAEAVMESEVIRKQRAAMVQAREALAIAPLESPSGSYLRMREQALAQLDAALGGV